MLKLLRLDLSFNHTLGEENRKASSRVYYNSLSHDSKAHLGKLILDLEAFFLNTRIKNF